VPRLPLLAALLPALLAAAPREIAAHDGAHVQRPRFSPSGARLSYEANDHLTKRVTLYTGPAPAGAGPAPAGTGPAPAGTGAASALAFQPVRPAAAASGLTAGFATSSTEPRVVQDLSWSPAALDRYVVAVSDGTDSELHLERAGVIAPHPAADGGPAWSPDGRSVVFTSARTGEGDLYLLDLARLSTPPRQLTSMPDASEVYATWSPDSRAVAFVAHGQAGDHLWLLPNLDGRPVQLTRWPGVQTRPTYSPDGQWIAFYANREEERRFDLYVLRPLHLADPILVLAGVVPDADGPTWSPDGRHLVAVMDDDVAFDPVVAVPVADPLRPVVLELGTVGHGDLDLTAAPGGGWRIAVAALGTTAEAHGLRGGERVGFRRLYLVDVPAPP
jgi:dipeptidyl aminopeptidase/acylaminoacyl peptidase